MSTYGGDSWVPEAMHRKHQVDQVLADVHQLDRYANHWRRLSNGRIACLVCPHRPVLDTFPMLIVRGYSLPLWLLLRGNKDLRGFAGFSVIGSSLESTFCAAVLLKSLGFSYVGS